MRPTKVLRSPALVMVTKLVMTTSSLGIIISDKNSVNTRSFPRNSSRAKAKAASTVTTSISPVVSSVNTTVLAKYRASGTAVKASR